MTFTYFGGPRCGETVSGMDQACIQVFYGAHNGTYTREGATRRYVWRQGKRVSV